MPDPSDPVASELATGQAERMSGSLPDRSSCQTANPRCSTYGSWKFVTVGFAFLKAYFINSPRELYNSKRNRLLPSKAIHNETTFGGYQGSIFVDIPHAHAQHAHAHVHVHAHDMYP